MTRKKRKLVNEQLLIDFSHWLEMLGYQATTVYGMGKYLYYLLLYVEDNGLQIDEAALQRYIYHVKQRPKMRKGTGPLSASSLVGIYRMISLLQEYFLLMKNVLLDVYIPPLKKAPSLRKPLNKQQVASLSLVIEREKNMPLRLRDHAILAILYGCGLRLGEVRRLQIKDLLFSRSLLYVLPGKTGRGRYVPMTEGIIKSLKDYVYEGRYAAKPAYAGHLFISRRGNALNKGGYRERLKKWEAAAKLPLPLTPHVLRHSIATHLLKAGMPIEQIGNFLGHRNLGSTQIYTHIV